MEKFIKLVKVLKILGVLIAIGVIFYVADYVIYKRTGNSLAFFKSHEVQTEVENTPAPENTPDEKEKLDEELKETEDKILKEAMTQFLNNKENNGFILSEYKEPKKIDPYYIFAKPEYHEKDDAKVKQYEEMTNSEVTTGLFSINEDKAIEIFLNKTGIEFSKDEIRDMMYKSFVYLPPENSYYTLNSDDLYTKVKCTKIEETEDKIAVTYEPEGELGNYVKGTVTLKRNSNQDGWIFVSNEITSRNV